MRRTNKSYRLGLQPHFNSSAHSTFVLWKYRWEAYLNSGSSRASGLNSITLHINRKHIVLKTRVVLFFFFFLIQSKRQQEWSKWHKMTLTISPRKWQSEINDLQKKNGFSHSLKCIPNNCIVYHQQSESEHCRGKGELHFL